MAGTNQISNESAERAALIHRENIQIGVLILIAVAAFFLTRAFADSNRDMTLRDAAEWHRRGQQALADGRRDDAIEDFHRATVRNRFEKRSLLDLARALRSTGENDEARGALLTLRESAPEDPDVNLEFESNLKNAATLEQDTIEIGVDLIDRIEQWTARGCGPATALDRALVLIGQQHRGQEP